jgi:transposase
VSDLVGDARHLSPSAQEALRLRAVAALVAGRDRKDVAAIFGVSLKAVDGWWAKWQSGEQHRARDQANSLPRHAASSADASASRTSSAATSEARTSAISRTRTP